MIEVENLGKTYVTEPVVRDLSFFVPEGQVLGFLGPNGAGKTTVMRMLTDPVGLRRNVGYLPENVPLYPELRVEEYLRFRADVEGVPRAEVAARVDDVIARCLIADVRRQVVGTLSKGYRQRVGLAGALIHRPKVLILDEPTVGLDPNQIIKVRELITELGREHTVLLSTHILPEVPDALRSRLVGNPSLAVELAGGGEAAAAALAALPGVVGVEAKGEGRFHLEHGAGSDPREAVFRLAVERGWVLLEMSPQRATLEDVFVRLTTHEDTVAGQELEVRHA